MLITLDLFFQQHTRNFVCGLHKYYTYSASLFRLLHNMHNKKPMEKLYKMTCHYVAAILRMTSDIKSPLTNVLETFDMEEMQFQEVKKKEPKAEIDISSAEKILIHLSNVQASQLEKEICSVVSSAMKGGKMVPVIAALTQLLLTGVSIKNEGDIQKGTSPPSALLLDWLQVLDPELEKGSNQLQQILLFKKRAGNEQKQGSYSQAYLLAAFTHQARWDTLEHCVRSLLNVYIPTLDPSAVLGFVWALLHVPKLWQGRERRTPRHAPQETLLTFSTSEIVHLAQYMIADCQSALEAGRGISSLEKHLPLLLHCLNNSSVAMQALAEHLAALSQGTTSQSQAAGHLLHHLYLRMPRLISYLPPGTMTRVVMSGAVGGRAQESGADVALHTLLTMLAAPQTGRDFRMRMCDLEAAVRKQAVSHPLIVLRHLPLLAASLKGTNHLQLTALRSSNYLELFSMILGVLELLQPLLFAPQHHEALTPLLDSFMALLTEHGKVHDLGNLIVRFSHLLMEWVGCQGGPAGTYLCVHSNLLATLQTHHPDIPALRSLAAIAAARGMDQPKESSVNQQQASIDVTLLSGCSQGPMPPRWVMGQVSEMQARLECPLLPEEQLEILRKVSEHADRWVNAVLPLFTHIFCEGIVSHNREVRLMCWELISRLLHHRPSLGGRIGQAVLAALKDEDTAVVDTALEHLPEVILLLHDQAPDLLCAAFVSALTSSPNASSSLSEALSLLHLHTGS